jgi:hypothetical protein
MDNVSGDVLASEHFKGHQLVLCFSDIIIRAKFGLKSLDKFIPIVEPGWLLVESYGEFRFKPLEGLPMEVR